MPRPAARTSHGAPATSVDAPVLAVRLVPTWPEMGRRYDAPADATPDRTEVAAQEPGEEPGQQENLDLWKAMDEGRDPTA